MRDVADEVLVLLDYLSSGRACAIRAQKQRHERKERGSIAVDLMDLLGSKGLPIEASPALLNS